MERTVSIERYANVPYEDAGAALRAQGPDVVLDDPVAGTIALDADVAGFVVSRPVTPRIDLTRELDPHAVVLPLAWQAAGTWISAPFVDAEKKNHQPSTYREIPTRGC